METIGHVRSLQPFLVSSHNAAYGEERCVTTLKTALLQTIMCSDWQRGMFSTKLCLFSIAFWRTESLN